jgi:hypothetical protein
MFDLIVAGLIGAFIGWNIPQPWWAVLAQNKVMGWIRGDK